MKLLILVAVVCLCSGANANSFMDTLHGAVSTLTSSLKEAVAGIKAPAAALMNNVVSQVKTQGQQMLMQLVSSSFATLGQPKTRDASLMTGVNTMLTKGKEAINKMTDTMSGLYQGAMDNLHEIMDKITSLKFLEHPLQNIKDKIDEVINLHSLLQGGLLNSMIKNPVGIITDAAKDLMGHFGHKRSAPLDALKTTGHAIGDLFTKLIGGFSQHIHAFGDIAKAMAAEIAGKLSGHVSTIKDGVNEIVGHGKNAMQAMTAAFKDIAAQTVANMTPSLTKIIGSTKDAVNTAINSLAGGH